MALAISTQLHNIRSYIHTFIRKTRQWRCWNEPNFTLSRPWRTGCASGARCCLFSCYHIDCGTTHLAADISAQHVWPSAVSTSSVFECRAGKSSFSGPDQIRPWANGSSLPPMLNVSVRSRWAGVWLWRRQQVSTFYQPCLNAKSVWLYQWRNQDFFKGGPEQNVSYILYSVQKGAKYQHNISSPPCNRLFWSSHITNIFQTHAAKVQMT